MGEAGVTEVLPDESEDQERTSKRVRIKRRKQRPRMTERQVVKALQAVANGGNHAEVAIAADISVAQARRIRDQFTGIFGALAEVDDFRKVRTEILEAVELTGLKGAIDESKMKRVNAFQAMQIAEKAQKMRRLEQGLSTENHAHAHKYLGPPKPPDTE